MTPRSRPARGAAALLALRRRFEQSPAFTRLPEPGAGAVVALGGLAGSSKALLTAALRDRGDRTLFVCCADEIEAEEWAEDLLLFSRQGQPGGEPVILPALDCDEDLEPRPTSLASRRAVLDGLHPGSVLLVEMASLMAPVGATPSESAPHIELRRGQTHVPRALLDQATDAGMRRVPQVWNVSEVSLRGDVLDIFPSDARKPIRIEFFDDEIESIRHFDPTDQSSTEELECASIGLPIERASIGPAGAETVFPLDVVASGTTTVIVVEPVRFEEQLSRFTLREGTLAQPVAAFQAGLTRFPSYTCSALPVTNGYNFDIAPPALAAAESWDLKGRILAAGRLAERPFVVLRSEPEVQRLIRLAQKTGDSGIDATTGHLTRGFRLKDLGCVLLNHGEFFGTGVARRRRVGKTRQAVVPSRVIDSFFELASGDLVVHAVHGIAKFVGMERTRRGTAGGEEDHLRLAFQGDVEVLVPASKIDLVQKYVGSGQLRPKLDKLGGKAFSKRKTQVAQALRDMAADLIEVQIERQRQPGFACPDEDELYDEFVRAFEYVDTPDQDKSTTEIVRDLCAGRPMDRLLCGDVGFGKTELAMRAAFRVVSAGRQVAMLVPTTLLADQHGRTFRDRFASFPARIEVLSRLQSPKEKRRILADTLAGTVDVLIGTHRLLNKDVKFRELGLLIIDEEQKFGVAHKEKIRQIRANVDVLTMTATPIPRTLHMSLLGIKDISSLATPPEGRLEIETQVLHRQASVIRGAIVNELARGGQVFFLHNRVYDIDAVRRELEDLVPEARFVVGHGQMDKKQLLTAMQTFLSGKADVLLSTTIVESGIDIPRANTILVDNAHLFGLADLHQLRGRVGRDVHKAHCFLLVDPAFPMKPEARKRLQAMEKFAGLGAGFQIAMRDLEIRGAGNLLGPEQSGHIAAIGYDMYCRLLHAAVERTDGRARTEEPPDLVVSRQVDVDIGVEAFLPPEFAEDQRMRLALLREMDTAVDRESQDRILASLSDRFGHVPAPALNLLALFAVKHQLGSRGMDSIRFVAPDQLIVTHAPGRGPQGSWLATFVDVRPFRPDRTCLVLAPRREPYAPEDVLGLLEESLLGRVSTTRIHEPRKRRRSRRRRSNKS